MRGQDLNLRPSGYEHDGLRYREIPIAPSALILLGMDYRPLLLYPCRSRDLVGTVWE